jgi:hypothetical protein
MSNPVSIDTTVRYASMRQIHGAIDHLHGGDFECAITLAAAGGGVLPPTDKPHLFQKLIAFANSLPTDEKVNDIINWLKHATTKKGGARIENATITEDEMIATIARSISKFAAVYDYQSPQMAQFINWAATRLQEKSTGGGSAV